MNGPFATLLATVIVVYLTLVPLVFSFGPAGSDIESAITEFGAQLEPGAVGFQAVALGLLGALFVATVIAPSSDVRNQAGVDVGAALAAHFLAAVVISTAIFTFIGTVNDNHRAGRVWFVILLSAVGFGLTQAIDAGITFGKKRQRRRTKNDLIVTSWGVHRRASALRLHDNVRRAPTRRLALLLIATTFIAAVAGTAIVAVSYSDGIGIAFPTILGWALIVATWGTFWVCFLVATIDGPAPARFLVASALAIVMLTTVAPAAAIAAAPVDGRATPFKVAFVVTMLGPFVLLLGRLRQKYSLRAALLAVELRRYRRRRLVLVRDYYALKKRRRTRDRNQMEQAWEDRALRALLHVGEGQKQSALPKAVSLQRHRPDTGIGSDEWWVAAGEPPMYLRQGG